MLKVALIIGAHYLLQLFSNTAIASQLGNSIYRISVLENSHFVCDYSIQVASDFHDIKDQVKISAIHYMYPAYSINVLKKPLYATNNSQKEFNNKF